MEKKLNYIKNNINNIRKNILECFLVAVSKSVGIEEIQIAYESGQRIFAENRVQDLLKKCESLSDFTDIEWHLIGHLQTNKVEKIIPHVSLIHSLDSVRLAEKISEVSLKRGKIQKVLIQANMSGEESKYGITPDLVETFYQEISTLKGISVQGLMTMGPLTESEEEIVRCFQKTGDLFLKLKNKFSGSFNILSMGMTDDYLLAIPYGATHLRIGRGIFSPGDQNA